MTDVTGVIVVTSTSNFHDESNVPGRMHARKVKTVKIAWKSISLLRIIQSKEISFYVTLKIYKNPIECCKLLILCSVIFVYK